MELINFLVQKVAASDDMSAYIDVLHTYFDCTEFDKALFAYLYKNATEETRSFVARILAQQEQLSASQGMIAETA